MAPRRGKQVQQVVEEVVEEQPEEDNEGLETLQFNEPLSWRPGKPIATDTLLKRLDRLSKELQEMDQDQVDQNSLVKVAKELVSHQLLSHKDKGVRAFTACCLVDILKLCAPNAPFTPSQLRDIFSLCINSIIPALFDPMNPYNDQHTYVISSFAEVKSIVLLLDVEGSDNLLLNLFTIIFDGFLKAGSGSKSTSSEQVTKEVEFAMQEVLGILIEEATNLPSKVVDSIMGQFLQSASPGAGKSNHGLIDESQATLLSKEEPLAYQMAKNLCHQFPDKMSRYVSQYFSDVIIDATTTTTKANGHKDGDSDDEGAPTVPSEADLHELRKAHMLIRELWRAAPQILQNVIPQVEAELSADNVELRQLATETLGDMISGIGAAGPPPFPVLDPAAYPPLSLDDETSDSSTANFMTTPLCSQSFSQSHPHVYSNFLSRKNDKTPSIRAAWTTGVGHILSTSGGGIGFSREEESLLIHGLGEKLNDSDEKVRLAAVKAIECFKFGDIILKLGPNGGVDKNGSVLSSLADRCRDKRPAVRVEAMKLLGNLWGVGAGELLAGNEAVVGALAGIPSRILNVFYANDPDLYALLDRVIYDCLVPLSFPPAPKKSGKGNNGASQSQSQAVVSSSVDQDAIRAERILLLARSLDSAAKKAFYALQARQPQFADILETFVKSCEQYNGGVMDEGEEKKTGNLQKAINYLVRFLADGIKAKSDLHRFARANDRRNYHLIRYVIGQEYDFRTVYKALREFTKRIRDSKEPALLETLLPLVYRSGCFIFNRSHLPAFMDYSKSDKDGLGAIAHEVLNEISQRNPDLFKAHIGDLCKDLIDQAPEEGKPNDPGVVETLKACASYSRKYPKEIPTTRPFTQTMINYALYGQPPSAAKYAVHILLAKKDSKSLTVAADLVQKTMKDWEYGGPHFLNKLTTLSQLELLAPKVMEDVDSTILDICVQQLLLQVRTPATPANERDPEWVDDADLEDECKAKCLALKILVNRLRGMEDLDATDTEGPANATLNMLKKLIKEKGEVAKGNDTPARHKSKLRLVAAKLMLKLCTLKQFDERLTIEDFDNLAWLAQDGVSEVRHGFVSKLQKYLAENRLKPRYYTIVFLTAFEPNSDYKQRVETWIRSRARYFEENKQQVMEATMPRLICLLAHHPDYSPELADLVDHSRYLIYYLSLVATESNLGMINKYAERVKQTKDALHPDWDNHRVLSDLAQAAIRKWQEKKNWTFLAYPGKVGLPLGLYIGLTSHNAAQEAASTVYIPEGTEEKLDELLRAMDRKKKRKSVAENGDSNHPSKRAKSVAGKTAGSKEARPKASVKKSAPRPKKTPAKKVSRSSPVITDSERRKSARSRKSNTYIERDDSEDDKEMLEGVAEWEYEKSGDEDDQPSDNESEPEHAGDDKNADSESELSDIESTAAGSPSPTPAPQPKKKPEPKSRAAPAPKKKAPPPATKGDDESELSEIDSEQLDSEDEDEAAAPPPPPPKSNGKAAASKAKPKPVPPVAGGTSRLTRRAKKPVGYEEMEEDD